MKNKLLRFKMAIVWKILTFRVKNWSTLAAIYDVLFYYMINRFKEQYSLLPTLKLLQGHAKAIEDIKKLLTEEIK